MIGDHIRGREVSSRRGKPPIPRRLRSSPPCLFVAHTPAPAWVGVLGGLTGRLGITRPQPLPTIPLADIALSEAIISRTDVLADRLAAVSKGSLCAIPPDTHSVIDLVALITTKAVPVLFIAMQPSFWPKLVEEDGRNTDASEEAKRDLVLLVDELAGRGGGVSGL